MSKQGESAKAVRRGAGLPGVATEPDTQVSGAKWTGKGREVREGPRGFVNSGGIFGFYLCRGSHCAYRIMPETLNCGRKGGLDIVTCGHVAAGLFSAEG